MHRTTIALVGSVLLAAAIQPRAVSAATSAEVAADQKRTIPSGSAIYIEKMEGDLDGFIRAEITKKNVPLKVVLRLEDAHLVMTGNLSQRKGAWHEGWLTTERDKATASAMIIDRAKNEMIWASEAGDRSLFWGSLSRGGPRKVAGRLVDRIKDAIYGAAELPPPPPLSDEERAATAGVNAPGLASAPPAAAPMTNENVLELSSAGLAEELIIAKIKSSGTAFRVEAGDLVRLKAGGVTDKVLAAMLEATKKQP